jgi:hypothetical protein
MSDHPDPSATAGVPVALVDLHELGLIAEGSTVTVATINGSRVRIRLATVDEYIAEVKRAHHWFDEHGLHHPPVPQRDEVERLVRPIGGHR